MTLQFRDDWVACPTGELERMTATLRLHRWLRLGAAAVSAILLAGGLTWAVLHLSGLGAAAGAPQGTDCAPTGAPQEPCPTP